MLQFQLAFSMLERTQLCNKSLIHLSDTFESPRIARYRSTTVSPSNPASNFSTSSYCRRHCTPQRSCKIIERSFDVRISNEYARTRDKAEGGGGRKKGRKEKKSGGPSAGVTFGEPVKKKRCTVVVMRVRTRVQNTRAGRVPHTFHYAYIYAALFV